MKTMLRYLFIMAALISVPAAHAVESAPLKLASKITLPDVNGRLDHLAVDLNKERLFIAAVGNHTLEVVDLKDGKRTFSIGGFKKPQGVVFVPEYNKIYVTDGGSGECYILDGDSLKLVNIIMLPGGADNIRYEPASKLVYVGYGKGVIGVIDPSVDKLVGRIALDGRPESFQVESSGNRIFVNVPDAGNVSAVDKARGAVIDRWSLPNVKNNFSMALDEAGRRAFIGCNSPSTLVVYNTKSGEYVAKLKLDKDADDIYYDPAHTRVYISCGSGFIDCVGIDETNHCAAIANVKTAKGARTSLFVPEQNRFYLAVPRQGREPAEVWVYDIQ